MPNNWLEQAYQAYNAKADAAKTRQVARPLSKSAKIGAKAGPSAYRKLLELLTGYPADPDQQIGPADVLMSGLPFAAYGKKAVFHGTTKAFEKLDPALYDARDTLGWMTHFAENPSYANQWASGAMKGPTKAIDLNAPGPVQWDEVLQFPYEGFKEVPTKLSPNVIPAKINAKNVYDATNPSEMDLEAILAALPPGQREARINQFKSMRQYYAGAPENFESDATATKYVGHSVLENLKNPATFRRTPFDAVRYQDGMQPSWAVPDPSQAVTPWGTPLGDAYRPPVKVTEVPSVPHSKIEKPSLYTAKLIHPVTKQMHQVSVTPDAFNQMLAEGWTLP